MTAAMAAAASAQPYPSRPITMIVPFGAGGPTDALARIITQRMSVTLGQSILIENITGAAGTIAVGRVARSDITVCGGITLARKAMILAETAGMNCEVMCWGYTLISVANLHLSESASPSNVALDRRVTLTYSVSNGGPNTASDVGQKVLPR